MSRPPRGVVRASLVASVLVGALLTPTACGLSRTGTIKEVETGRNGVKVEVYGDAAGNDDYEVYLVPGMQEHCQVDELLTDCADADDYLVPRAGARPGVNR